MRHTPEVVDEIAEKLRALSAIDAQDGKLAPRTGALRGGPSTSGPPCPGPSPSILTAVQLRAAGAIAARLLCGTPLSTVSSSHGEIALLPGGQIAAYLVRHGDAAGFYIFRTGCAGALSLVPGVREPVRLFLSTGRRSAAARTRNFLRKLSRYGHDPSALSDDFWTRAAGAFVARARSTLQLLPSLLAREAAR